jgi:hypothetical protein
MYYPPEQMSGFNSLLVVGLRNLKSLLNGFLRLYGKIIHVHG